MKKKAILCCCVLLLLLLIPIPTGICKDGGTKVYTAMTYKIVVWNRLLDIDNVYHKTSVFWFPEHYKSIDALWEIENSR